MEEVLTIAMPHCGMRADSFSGGEVVERELLPRVLDRGVDPHVLRPSWLGLRWWNSPLYFRRAIHDCVHRHRPRLLRAHSLRYAGPAALWAKRHYGLSFIAHFHHLETDRLSWLDRWVLRHADLVTTDSEFSRRQAKAVGIESVAVPLGVVHRRPSRMPEDRIVLFLGGDKPRKNLPFLLDLWPDVVRLAPGARLVIVGPGHWLSRTDVEVDVLYTRARVLAFPSRLEGFGLPVLEAMAHGRPVVCSDQGALPELEATSTLPLARDHWVDALVRYLTDDEAWMTAAERNLSRAKVYSWERMAEQTVAAWRSLA